jgi:DNA mismatch repair ATPase MutS
MMQCGLFIAAESLTANVCQAVFTHFKRGEDTNMESGKLDKELARMSENADNAQPNSLVLCNESFAATNEHEGSQIALQIITALIDSDIQVALVTEPSFSVPARTVTVTGPRSTRRAVEMGVPRTPFASLSRG